MLLGAAAELISLGAVVPFIAVLSNPERAIETPVVETLLSTFGISASEVVISVSISFASLVVISTLVRLVLLWVTNKVVFDIGFDLGVGVFTKTLCRPYAWHVSRNSSEVLGGLNKAQIVVQSYLLPLLNALVAFVLATGMIAMLVFVDPFVAMAGTGAFALCYFGMALAIRKKIASNGLVIAKADNRRIQEMQEGIGGIRDVILDSSQSIYTNRFSRVDAEMRKAQATNIFLSSSPRLAIEGIGLIIIALFALIASKSGGVNELLPVLGALGLGAQKLMPLIQTIYAGWNASVSNRPSLHDVIDLLDTPDEDLKPIRVEFRHSIELLKMEYFYPSVTDKPALSDINLKIEKGQVIGIVGKTGSGKSTLVDILMGLIPASSGQFLVDKIDLDSKQKLRGWSMGVAHVPQSIFLADCSIAQNIALGVESSLIDYKRLEQAAKAAEIHDYITSLKRGYETDVGERGVRLSGGQRQRIGIARALYRQAQFLVLDEATSALDDETEKRVISNIHRVYPDLTIVMVAHRLSTLKKCDFIVKLEQGTILHVFDYEQLIQA
jgi:ABC-type multidrug transport system fused ATPase/permease subunit